MRAHDWSATPLGPVEHWPQALRTVLRLVLSARQPLFVFWGPQLLCLYNDAYRVTLSADRHPRALGRPGRDVWPEVWDTLGAEIERVRTGGPATWHERERVPLVRDGRLQDTWWTFGYSPIDDETAPGGIGGVLALTMEVTEEVRSHERLRRMFDQAPSFMALLEGPDHQFVAANDAYRALIDRDALVGRTVREVLPEVEEQGYLDMLDRVFATGEPVIGRGARVDVERPGGGPRARLWIDFIYQAMRGPDGRIQGIFVEGHDVTEQHRAIEALRESESRLMLAFRAASLGWWDMDARTLRMTWSPEALRMFDLPPDGSIALELAVSRIHPEDRPRVERSIAGAMAHDAGGDYREVYRVVWRDGTVRWMDAVGRVDFEADADGVRRAVRFPGVLRDVTEQQTLIERLREADRRKDEFLAMLAHELRNPLAPIANAVRLLEREAGLSDIGRRAVGMASRQARQMRRLVEDLLEVSRITRGTIELRPERLLLGAAVHAAVEAASVGGVSRDHAVEVDLPREAVWIVADPVRLAQMLGNLLTNACKYTPPGGRIAVSARRDGDEIELQVRDDGIGIDPADLDRVFELFVQAEPGVGPHQGGLGIGLALVRRLAELHGGSVRAESEGRARGATFVLRLPSRPPAPSAR